MRKVVSSLLVFVFVLIVAAPTFAAAMKEKPVTVQGDLVDSKCYLHMGMRAGGHQACAEGCAADGVPVCIVDKKGNTTLLLMGNPAAFASMMNKPAKATGIIIGGKGKVQSMQPSSLEIDGKAVTLPKSGPM